jgi:hypothetical protein
MGTVTISGTTFEIYGLATDANDYFKAHSDAASWTAASTTVKNQALVTAARSFDRQRWAGVATDLVTPQPLAWPRTGLTDREGQPVPSGAIPQDVLEGNWEWALAVVMDGAVAGETPGTNTKRVRTREKVDVIEVESETELFKSTVGQTSRFPTAVMELIGLWLEGGDASLSFVSGTDVTSGFTTDDTDFGFSSPGADGGSNA